MPAEPKLTQTEYDMNLFTRKKRRKARITQDDHLEMNNVWRCEYSKHRMSSRKVVLLLFLWGLENTDGNRAIGEL